MIINQLNYFILFVISFISVGLLTPVMRKIAISKKILDYPNSAHKSHLNPIPYLGGLAIIIGIVTVTYGALLFSDFTIKNVLLASSLLGPAVVMGIIGLWDDIKQLSPLSRFIAQTISGVVVAVILIISNNSGNPTGSTFLDMLISIIWVIGICNAINFFDNLDGGAAGTTAVSAIAITLIAINVGQSLIASLSLVLAGATLGFLIWNKSPARIYMGDAGSLFIGVILSTLTIRLNPDTESTITSFSIPILILAVPILDTCVAVISRLRRRASPFQGGKDHLAHRLVRHGLSRKSSALILWFTSIFFAAIAVMISTNILNQDISLLILAAIIWIALLFRFLGTNDF